MIENDCIIEIKQKYQIDLEEVEDLQLRIEELKEVNKEERVVKEILFMQKEKEWLKK